MPQSLAPKKLAKLPKEGPLINGTTERVITNPNKPKN
jgi:hypothetical protein